MAKSTRSKVKRHFRAKKREQGVYAATEDARLHRLNMKLKALITTDEGGDEGAQMPEDGAEGEKGEWVDESPAGWSPFWFAALGLVDPDDITAERMGQLCQPFQSPTVGPLREGGIPRLGNEHSRTGALAVSDCPTELDSLFAGPCPVVPSGYDG